MFKNLRNNYYFGKAGKADYTVEDMPTNRWQLFTVTLRTRLSALLKVNLLYAIAFVPALIVLVIYLSNIWQVMIQTDLGDGTTLYSMTLQQATEEEREGAAPGVVLSGKDANSLTDYNLFHMLLWLAPCIALTGPFTAGVSYLTRNWARDEHAFPWSDFKDALKDNWKQGLAVSTITGALFPLLYVAYTFYRDMAQTQLFMVVPQAIVAILAILWALAVTYMYPLMVSYEMRFWDLMRNAFLLAVARLPFSAGIRLLHCVPAGLAIGVIFLFPGAMSYAVMALFLWYALLGFMLSRFVTASYTNAVFDRFINPNIRGAKVNRGLYHEEDDAEDVPAEAQEDKSFDKPEA